MANNGNIQQYTQENPGEGAHIGWKYVRNQRREAGPWLARGSLPGVVATTGNLQICL